MNWIQQLFSPKKFVKTTNGNVARVEKENKKLNNILVSFGSFDTEGEWIISKTVTISDINVTSYLTKEEVAKELTVKYTGRGNKNSNAPHF